MQEVRHERWSPDCQWKGIRLPQSHWRIRVVETPPTSTGISWSHRGTEIGYLDFFPLEMDQHLAYRRFSPMHRFLRMSLIFDLSAPQNKMFPFSDVRYAEDGIYG
jgi:hypothetical protein